MNAHRPSPRRPLRRSHKPVGTGTDALHRLSILNSYSHKLVGTGVLDCPKAKDYNDFKTATVSPFYFHQIWSMDSRGRLSLQFNMSEQRLFVSMSPQFNMSEQRLFMSISPQFNMNEQGLFMSMSPQFSMNEQRLFMSMSPQFNMSRISYQFKPFGRTQLSPTM